MLTFAVSEEKNRWLRQKMQELNVREEELEEQFIRSSGRGGQHVNKSSTAVQLRHRPTGTMVTCMQDRSQSTNRFLARRELLEKLELLLKGASPRSTKAERSRKQKARRKRRSEAKYDPVPPSGHEESEKG